MRGAQFGSIPMRRQLRIIPADAGSTRNTGGIDPDSQDHPRGCGEHYAGTLKDRAERDHPRGCGEHLLSMTTTPEGIGSSPRMRGALLCECIVAEYGGIIPADAGST